MTSQSGIGQQVTQRTTQHGSPHIRILVTCGQVVDGYQDDREQYDDLTQKHYILFGTHGTEQMPRSVVFVALRVSTVLCYDVLSLLFFFYDGGGGGGEVLCCRLVSHRSNEATTDARLVLIVDEGLDIDPVVEVGGVVVQFHQSLRSSAHIAAGTDSTRYTLSAGTDTFCSSGS